MTPTLTATNPVPPSGVSTVKGAGFENRKVCLSLDGQGAATNIFRPGKDGSFSVGITVSSTPKTQKLTARYVSAVVDAASTSIVVQAAAPPPVSTIRFGMAAHFMWGVPMADVIADLDRMKAAGMTYVRFDASWHNMEPAKGSYMYLATLDQILNACAARGIATTITVIETPTWANGGGGKFVPPTNPNDYGSFLGMLARRYGSRVGAWEIWNEPNEPSYWTTGPNAAQYAALLKAAYAPIKAGDPSTTVLGGSISCNDLNFLNGIYAAGAGNSFDGLAIHPYCLALPPGDKTKLYYSFAASVPQFQSVLAEHGQSAKPIWITEMGWPTTTVSDTTRAVYLRDAVAIARTWSNVKGVAVYTLHQSQFAAYGLLTTTNAPTASWDGYVAALK